MQAVQRAFASEQLTRILRMLLPSLLALSFTTAAHAQGTMDFSGAQTLMGTFKTLLAIIAKAGGWRHSLYLKIENPPYMELVIEAVDESGPSGLPALSVAHYGIQNGDLMRDPEMCFELRSASGESHLNPYYWRNDYVGIEQWSRSIQDGLLVYDRRLHAQHQQFAEVWDTNLREQGFAEAFTDKCILG